MGQAPRWAKRQSKPPSDLPRGCVCPRAAMLPHGISRVTCMSKCVVNYARARPSDKFCSFCGVGLIGLVYMWLTFALFPCTCSGRCTRGAAATRSARKRNATTTTAAAAAAKARKNAATYACASGMPLLLLLLLRLPVAVVDRIRYEASDRASEPLPATPQRPSTSPPIHPRSSTQPRLRLRPRRAITITAATAAAAATATAAATVVVGTAKLILLRPRHPPMDLPCQVEVIARWWCVKCVAKSARVEPL